MGSPSLVLAVVKLRGGGLKYENASMTFRTGVEWMTQEVYLMVDVLLGASFSGGIILSLNGRIPVFSHACKIRSGVNVLRYAEPNDFPKSFFVIPRLCSFSNDLISPAQLCFSGAKHTTSRPWRRWVQWDG